METDRFFGLGVRLGAMLVVYLALASAWFVLV
jgi:hypothetical protein